MYPSWKRHQKQVKVRCWEMGAKLGMTTQALLMAMITIRPVLHWQITVVKIVYQLLGHLLAPIMDRSVVGRSSEDIWEVPVSCFSAAHLHIIPLHCPVSQHFIKHCRNPDIYMLVLFGRIILVAVALFCDQPLQLSKEPFAVGSQWAFTTNDTYTGASFTPTLQGIHSKTTPNPFSMPLAGSTLCKLHVSSSYLQCVTPKYAYIVWFPDLEI